MGNGSFLSGTKNTITSVFTKNCTVCQILTVFYLYAKTLRHLFANYCSRIYSSSEINNTIIMQSLYDSFASMTFKSFLKENVFWLLFSQFLFFFLIRFFFLQWVLNLMSDCLDLSAWSGKSLTWPGTKNIALILYSVYGQQFWIPDKSHPYQLHENLIPELVPCCCYHKLNITTDADFEVWLWRFCSRALVR